MANFRTIFAVAAVSLGLFACSSDDEPAAAGAGGSPGVVATRAESCLTIDKGASGVVEQGVKQAGASAGAGGGGGAGGAVESKSMCDTLYTGCTDADLAALVPQYECMSKHAGETTEAILSACPSSAKLSDACNTSINKAVSGTKGPSGYTSPQACWDACKNCSCTGCSVNLATLDQCPGQQTLEGCNFTCFFFWWAL